MKKNIDNDIANDKIVIRSLFFHHKIIHIVIFSVFLLIRTHFVKKFRKKMLINYYI